MRYMHVERSHKCSVCEKGFKRAIDLKVHFAERLKFAYNIISIFSRSIWPHTQDKICTIVIIVRRHLSRMPICILTEKKLTLLNGMRIV